MAVKISALFADVDSAIPKEKMAVNMIIRPIRMIMRLTKNKTSTVIVGNNDPTTDTITLLVRAIPSSE